MGIYSTPPKRYGWQQWNCNVVGCPPSTSSGGGAATCVDISAADLYQLTVTDKLDACVTYRIKDYKSVNWLNGYWQADNNNPPQTTPAGSLLDPFTFNANENLQLYSFKTVYQISKSTYDGSYIVAGEISIYRGHDSWGIMKIGVNGLPITSFKTPYSTGGFGNPISATGYAFTELANGSIIANIYLEPPIIGAFFTGIAKLNSDGSIDLTYAANGIYPNYRAYAIANQSTGKTIVAGMFTSYEDNLSTVYNRNYIIRLNVDGSEDTAFYTTLGTAFDGPIRSVVILPDDSMIIGGEFTAFDGGSAKYIIKLNADGTRNTAFDTNVGAGFGNNVLGITYDSVANGYIVYGLFTTFDGNSYDKVVRILADGTVDPSWIGGLTINGDVLSATVDTGSGSVYIGGNFVDIDGDANAHNVAFLTSDGSSYSTFSGTGFAGDATSLVYDSITTGVVVGGPADFDGTNLGYTTLSSITTKSTPTPNYNPREIYTSPDDEVIVIKATGTHTFEPVAYSETYGDILEFMPYCNKIGVPYPNGLYNGVTLPDSTILTGFNLQWDGTQAYIDMPANYPALFGHLMYIYFGFNSTDDFFEFLREPLVPGINDNWLVQSPYTLGKVLLYPVIVEGDGVRIVIPDITYDMFLDYNIDSLYIDTVEALGPAYGWVTRRIDTRRQIDAPLDWRNFRYRRWEMDVYNDGTEFAYIGCTGDVYSPPASLGAVVTTGDYKDLPVFCPQTYNTQIVGRGGTLNYWWWNGNVDNITFDSESTQLYPASVNIKIQFDYVSACALQANWSHVNMFGRIMVDTFQVGSYSGMDRVVMNNLSVATCIISGGLSGFFMELSELFAVILPTMSNFSITSWSAYGDFRSSPSFSTNGTKRILQASNGTAYLESFDGISYNYTASPF